MTIIGISAFYHDSAAALIIDGNIIAAAQEERFTRKKHDPAFPLHALRYCLDHAAITLNDVDAVVFYDKPLLKFERLLETYYAFAPKGFVSFNKAIPVWLREKLFHKREIRKGLKDTERGDPKGMRLLFPDHHLSHAASAYYPSPFEDAAVLTIDGVGEWSTASIFHGVGNRLELRASMGFPHSVGLLYSAFTYFLGFEVNGGEYKLMGLAPYGDASDRKVSDFRKTITEKLIKVYEDGSIWLDQRYFNYATGLTMTDNGRWRSLFGFARRTTEEPIEAHHCNLALAIQQVTEDIVLRMAATAKQLTGSSNLCLAGGVALNCVANGKLVESGMFDNVFVQPAAGDAGGALGAALAAYHISYGKDRSAILPDAMHDALLGPEASIATMEIALQETGLHYTRIDDEGAYCQHVAQYITEGHVIGWFQGRMEFGPRALGARSIMADARSAEMQQKVNLKIKFRESFRPFAPMLMEEDAHHYFDIQKPSPYMLQVHRLRPEWHTDLPAGYSALNWKQKLETVRSEFPAVTHVDLSCRVQTVSRTSNPKVHLLLSKIKDRTGHGMVINTSFNVKDEPIVCSPDDAIRCFQSTGMDVLAIGPFIVTKTSALDPKTTA